MIRTLTALVIGAASLMAGAPAFAGDDLAARHDTPPPQVDDFKAPEPGRQESTTCEGAVICTILGAACRLAGGTYNEWDSRDHGHPHGICTWPWE
ncbi:MAG TPA: hypothetical protein VNQ73_05285 [Ilumatobacter sp.]|nr:hypothetical protein [Ilumatobacter sp.]